MSGWKESVVGTLLAAEDTFPLSLQNEKSLRGWKESVERILLVAENMRSELFLKHSPSIHSRYFHSGERMGIPKATRNPTYSRGHQIGALL